MEWSLNSIAPKTGMVIRVYLIFFFIMLPFFFIMCKRIEDKKEFSFFYFPDKNVYYNPTKNEFWYSINGAKNWNKFANTSNAEPVSLGRKVVISTADSNVYKENENHRKIYGGRLYVIRASDTTSRPVGAEVTERVVIIKKKAPVTIQQEEKPKKGIGKLLNKIFGKHK